MTIVVKWWLNYGCHCYGHPDEKEEMTILADSACENIEASVVSCHVNWSLVGSIMVLFECLKRVVCHGVPLNPGDYHHVPYHK